MSKCLAILGCLLLFRVGAAQTSTFPDSDPQSGRFVNVTRGLSTLGNSSMSFQVEAIGSTLNLGIFDGNLGGKWDVAGTDDVRFTLYEDPTKSGATAVQVGTWLASTMPDDGWFSVVVPNATNASDGKRFVYLLVVSWDTANSTNEQNNFKLKVSPGYVYVPDGQTFEVIGYTPTDPAPTTFGPTIYDGTWKFRVAADIGTLTVWDGDFDRVDDDNDPLSPVLPNFPYSINTVRQAAIPGLPADDADVLSPLTVSPSVYYTVRLADGSMVTKTNPSGNREWELLTATSTLGGWADLNIFGADGRNTLFLNVSAPVYGEVEDPQPGPTRSKGYWKTHELELAKACPIDLGIVGGANLSALNIDQALAILKSNPGGLSKLAAARLKLEQQLIAAIANVKVLGTTPAGMGFPADLIEQARLTLAGTNVAAINSMMSQVEAFDLSGE